MAEDQNIKSQDTHQEYYDNNSKLKRSVLQITWIHTWLMVIAMVGSTIWFTSNTLGRIDNLEKETVILHRDDKALEIEVKKNSDIRILLFKNQILIKQNLRQLMAKFKMKWDDNLPDNFEEIIK
jgi:hypothetical protein